MQIDIGLKVLECDISSVSGSGVDIKQEAKAIEIAKCHIHDCGVCGIQMAGEAKCEIHHNHLERSMDGVLLWRAGKGSSGPVKIYDNLVSSNKGSGIGVHSQSNALVYNNEVEDSGQSGIYFSDYSEGVVEANWISKSGMAGVSVKSYAKPVVKRNAILDGYSAGVYIRGAAEGVIEDNTLLRNAKAGIGIKQHAKPIVKNNRISDGQVRTYPTPLKS